MANVKLSEKERIYILMIRGWGDRERSYDQVCSIFNEVYRNRDGLSPISKSIVERTIRRFRDHGTVTNLPKSGRPKTATTEAKRLDILQTLIENSHRSLRSIGMEHDVCHETVRQVEFCPKNNIFINETDKKMAIAQSNNKARALVINVVLCLVSPEQLTEYGTAEKFVSSFNLAVRKAVLSAPAPYQLKPAELH
ncbi:hypothetical protein PV326_002732 [Microctonus aethiopoides]|nr:hypothetical protein PV326_002732 [Microctonus aethiopoides]